MTARSRPAGGVDGVPEAHLRRLDAASLSALVVDLWAARGYETRRSEGTIVAERGDASVVIAPVAGGGRFRTPSLPARPFDVVVAPRADDDLVAAADAAGAEVVDAADLARMLRYAVGPATGRRLCERHLGAEPAALSPPPLVRLRGAVGGLRGRPALVVAVVALLWLGTLATVPGTGTLDAGLPAGAEPTGTPTASETPTDEPVDIRTLGPGLVAAPGLDRGGISNLTALIDAHERALSNRPFTAWLDVHRPRGGDPDGPRVQRDVDVAVAGDRYEANVVVESSDGDYSLRSVYRDGNRTYVANVSGPNATVRQLRPGERPLGRFDDPEALRGRIVGRYLQVRTSTIIGSFTRDGTTYFRVKGEGVSRTSAAAGVQDYSVIAVVSRRGLVVDLVAQFSFRSTEGTYPVQVEVTYGRLDETTVSPPPWYQRTVAGNDSDAHIDAPVAPGGRASTRPIRSPWAGRVAASWVGDRIAASWVGDRIAASWVGDRVTAPRTGDRIADRRRRVARPREREVLFS